MRNKNTLKISQFRSKLKWKLKLYLSSDISSNPFSTRDNSTSIKSERKLWNKLIKIMNGNIKNQMKILLWNKGNSLIKNKIEDIRDIIEEKSLRS